MDKTMIAILAVGGVFLLYYGFLFAVLIRDRKTYPENYPKPTKYDERQLADQEMATRYAFWVMTVYLLLWIFLESGLEIRLWESGFGAALCVMLGIGTFDIFCILRDAFFKPGDKARWVPVFLINFCLLSFAANLLGNDNAAFFRNGLLAKKAVAPLLLLHVILLDAALIVRRVKERKHT